MSGVAGGTTSMERDFQDRTALLCGASGALGGALTRRLAAAGARIAALDRKPERLTEELVAAGLAVGDRLSVHAVDFAELASVERGVDAAVARHGALHHVFNVAGAFGMADSVEATSDELWSKMWEANFRTTLQVCRAVAPRLKRQGEGTIVNVGSRGALRGDAGVVAYSVAKAAVVRLTESLAAEGKGNGMRANCVLPGTIDTPANRKAMPDADFSTWVDLDALVDAMLFLASPAARAVTGAALPVYGAG
ncbi:MAG: SDR family NAD(P)-dependent oxidoreductase [Holophagales bacterium]|nr:SDR family NAD(P)-dependent oxidoreductase [Holophagales bacterium]